MLDNVRFHHCKKTLKLITDTNNNYIFTPPYSSNNNPIEVIFSIIVIKISNGKNIENIFLSFSIFLYKKIPIWNYNNYIKNKLKK